jgi:hypothetical protein
MGGSDSAGHVVFVHDVAIASQQRDNDKRCSDSLVLTIRVTPAVSERITEGSDAAPFGRSRRSFLYGAGYNRASDRCIETFNREMQMNRRPMTLLVGRLSNGTCGCAACFFEHQVNRGGRACHFGDCLRTSVAQVTSGLS